MIEPHKLYALAITCGAKRGPKDSDLTFSPASLRDFLKALSPNETQIMNQANMEMLKILESMPHPEYMTGITHLTNDWYEWDSKRRAAIAAIQ